MAVVLAVGRRHSGIYLKGDLFALPPGGEELRYLLVVLAWPGVACGRVARRGVARRGVAWRGVAWRGVARRGGAGQSEVDFATSSSDGGA